MARRKARAGGGKGGGGTRGSAARVKRGSTRSGDAAAAGSGWTAAAGEAGLRRQLAARGLRIVPIESDGNCLFRALADQLFGGGPNTSGDHVSLRANAVRHMRENADTYSLFLEEVRALPVCQTPRDPWRAPAARWLRGVLTRPRAR